MDGTKLQRMIGRVRQEINPAGAAGLRDAELLQRWVLHRDEAAFEALLWRHAATVLGVCRRALGDAHEAEDAAQATFLALARKGGAIGEGQAVVAWLHTVAHRMALRARTLLPRAASLPAPHLDAFPARPADDPVWRDLRSVLDEEVSRLPLKYRAAFVVCHIEGRTNEEAARELGCPVGTIVSRLARARRRLRDRLTRRGVTLTAAALAALTGEAASAAVPPALIREAVRAATVAATWGGLTGVVSTEVVALTEGVMRAMLLTKVKAIAAVVFVFVLLGGGGVLGYRAVAGDPRATVAQAEPPVPAKEEKLATVLEDRKEIQDLQDRIKALEQQLQDRTWRLESALLSRKMDEIKERLAAGSGGKTTQGLQKEILARLDRTIKDLEDSRRKGTAGKLADLLAELKMVRAMQTRISMRTALYSQQYEAEVVPDPATGKSRAEKELFETLRRELKELSERQGKLSSIMYELASHGS
jgi:RNA polymerase sigma factor (sigma-70 family)